MLCACFTAGGEQVVPGNDLCPDESLWMSVCCATPSPWRLADQPGAVLGAADREKLM
jgi:hypothetical protein